MTNDNLISLALSKEDMVLEELQKRYSAGQIYVSTLWCKHFSQFSRWRELYMSVLGVSSKEVKAR